MCRITIIVAREPRFMARPSSETADGAVESLHGFVAAGLQVEGEATLSADGPFLCSPLSSPRSTTSISTTPAMRLTDIAPTDAMAVAQRLHAEQFSTSLQWFYSNTVRARAAA
jgi:hypothetical protein